MVFIGYLAKLANSWVYQTAHSQANIHIKDQPSQLTYGFKRILSQAISLVGLTGYSAKPANSWVYQVVHPRVTHG